MKKLLLVTYYWPPAGGPAIQRILKFVKFLPEMGWQPVVLTVKGGDYPAIDRGLVDEIPPDITVYRTRALEPFDLYRKLTGKKKHEKIPTFVLNPEKTDSYKDKVAKWIRAKLFIPDARIGWLPYAVSAGKKVIREENISLIFSTSPPHTVQLIAKKLAKVTHIPWVADFRDPWSEAFWVAELQREGIVKRINTSLEKSVLQYARAVTTVSEGVAELLRHKAENRYKIIHSGFETTHSSVKPAEKFIILFMGHHNKYQHREWFWAALRQLPEEVKRQTEFLFVGKIFDGAEAIFKKYSDLTIRILPYMSYTEVMQLAKSASILYRPLAQMSYAKGGVGTKMFDYLALRKPVLAIGEKGSAVEKILQETGSGKLFSKGETTEIIQFICHHFQQWQKNGYILLPETPGLQQYETQRNIARLANVFDEVVRKK